MVTTASGEVADRIRVASQHGMTRPAWSRYQALQPSRYDVVTPGFKYNMTDLQAAIGLHQLAAIDRHQARRRAITAIYDEALARVPVGHFAPVPPGTLHAHHLYPVIIDGSEGPTRDDIALALSVAGVATSVHFPAVHLHTFYRERFGYRRGQFPAAERIADTVLSLPLSPALADAQVDQVISALAAEFGV
jgi:dTDP-4-amino-4,6-dideoxygalactose transaminase